MCTFIYNLLFFCSINKSKKKISKRKLTSEEAVTNILRFVEADEDNNHFESDCEDELGFAGDDEIYDDDDRNAADEDSGDDDEVEDKSSSDDDQPQPHPQPGNRPPRKMLTYNRLVNLIDKSLDPNCFDPHEFSTVDDEEHETVLTGYLVLKKNPGIETILWTNKKRERVGRQRSCNILPRSPQPSTLLPPASGIESMTDVFHVLFTDEMTDLLINNTNDKIRHIKENLPPHFVESNKNTYIRLLTKKSFTHSLVCFIHGVFWDSQCTFIKFFFLKLLDIRYSLQQCPSPDSHF